MSRFVAVALALVALIGGLGALIVPHIKADARTASATGCQINSARGDIQHVIYFQFDNVHFTRDTPNVPSDLEQMPHLLNFLEGNGTLLTNQHTPLIAHTATDIITSATGLYPDRQGLAVSNSYRYFSPNGSSNSTGAFTYWTDPVSPPRNGVATDTNYNLVGANGKNAPAPWVPFTRAGCNFGAVSLANTVLENTGGDITTVFGPNSPQAAEVKSHPEQAYADFVGIAVHCAQGNAVCSQANGGLADKLPDEPKGYTGYQALYGHKYVAPQISPNGPLKDLNGNVITDTFNGSSYVGFPGFDGMSAATSLAYVAAMQEHNVPVTYAYISDAHDNHAAGRAFGPGEAGYVAQLKTYDDAFATFFNRLAQDGITPANTLFVATSDEGDHFVGGAPAPASCDGVTVPCTYSQIGELNTNYAGLLATQQGITTPFAVHSDSAPVVYITGNPDRAAPVTRAFEQATGKLTALNPLNGQTQTIATYMADPVGLKMLHMVTGDPARTPTFTMFANPDYYLYTGAPNCTSACLVENPSFAWNHGDVAPDINTTWVGLVGPGIRHQGAENDIWSDHTDIRPTMLLLLGLKDDYISEGRALFEVTETWAQPQTLRAHRETLTRLAQTYKQINAPVGTLSLATLKLSTMGLASASANDATYTQTESQISTATTQRDAIASTMATLLDSATFDGAQMDEQQLKGLIDQGNALIDQMQTAAAQ